MKDYLTGEKDPLTDPLIKNYYQSNIDLIRTIAIKSERSALIQNQQIRYRYGNSAVSRLHPETWKYYLNLSGEYHPTDKVITIRSLDTLEQIVFNKENLVNHPNTAIEYQYGTRYYRTLVSQHSILEDLIMGILMPCDITSAIEAEDGTILRYHQSLVEENEYSLIKDLEASVKRHLSRWYVDAYTITDEYYLMAYIASLYLFMTTKLLNLRDERRNTYEAHSFHVRMFLRGYMGLDQYYKFLTRKQAMYLYRNMPRLVKSMGYDSQFNELVEHLFTERNIQVLGYNVRQTNRIGEHYNPITVIQPELINHSQIVSHIEPLAPEVMFEKEKSVLYGTKDYYDARSEETIFRVNHINENRVITKNISLQAQENISVVPLSFNDIVLCHWGYMSATGLYTANVTFNNPRNGVNVTISTKNAFIYFYYLSLSYTSNTLAFDLAGSVQPSDLEELVNLNEIMQKRPVTRIPYFLARRHARVDELIPTNLTILADSQYRSSMTDTANELLGYSTRLTITDTTDLFYDLCSNIHLGYIRQHTLVNTFTDLNERAYARNMVYKLYQDSLVELESPTLEMEAFLIQNGLDSYDVVGEYLTNLILNLYQAGTGITVNVSKDKRTIAQAMISIMRSLTSYNIQYIDQVSDVDLTYVPLEPNMIHGYTNPDDDIGTIRVSRIEIGVVVQESESLHDSNYTFDRTDIYFDSTIVTLDKT